VDFRKIGAETILTVMIAPVVMYIYSSLSSLEKADAVHDVRYENLMEKVEENSKKIDANTATLKRIEEYIHGSKGNQRDIRTSSGY